MPKRTNAFQQLLYLVQTQLKDREDVAVTESKMLVDRNTGAERETDIAVECIVNGVPFIIAFECRGRSRKPSVDWVEQMLKKHETLSDKLVLVANHPFTALAADLARRNRAETIAFGEATNTDWVARIDQYASLFFASFDVSVQTYSTEYDLPSGATPLNQDQPVELRDAAGRTSPLYDAVNRLLTDQEAVGKRIAQLWYDTPVERRKPEHTVTIVIPTPVDQPLTIRQGDLSYPLTKLTVVLAVKIGEAALDMDKLSYRGVRVSHGTAQIRHGGLAGKTLRLVLTEQRDGNPRAAIALTGINGSESSPPNVIDIEPHHAPKDP